MLHLGPPFGLQLLIGQTVMAQALSLCKPTTSQHCHLMVYSTSCAYAGLLHAMLYSQHSIRPAMSAVSGPPPLSTRVKHQLLTHHLEP